jgi:hypothetical protein
MKLGARIAWLFFLLLAAAAALVVDRPPSVPGPVPHMSAVATARPSCEYWVAAAGSGSDGNPGTFDRPWATMAHAAEAAPDQHCTIWFSDGVYDAAGEVARRFQTPTVFRAVNPYRAVLEGSENVLKVNGAANITFEGFRLRHAGPDAVGAVVYVDGSDAGYAERLTFRNNIFHDSFDDDLLKLHDRSRRLLVEGNVFYNQGDLEEQLDVNSVSEVVIQDNIFFNDFERSGRADSETTKYYITVKDSNEDSDGLLGSRQVFIRRNIFLHWQGGLDSFVTIGNDGKPFHEAREVWVLNNLMIGNSAEQLDSAFSVTGARDVFFLNNSVVGDLPARSFAFRVGVKGSNPPNENILFANNIWSDPTGSMGGDGAGSPNDFSNGDSESTNGLRLENNLYWNQDAEVPGGELLSPLHDDASPHVADPLLTTDQEGLVVPYWKGSAFVSGATTIEDEFTRLAMTYGAIPASSPAAGQSLDTLAPRTDILGRPRDRTPDLGAFEAQARP